MNIPRPRRLADWTGDDFEGSCFSADAVVVLPVGAIEQHGPHLPVGTDALIAELLVRGMESRLAESEPVYMAPQVFISKSHEHVGFPGTLMISRSSLACVLKSWVDPLTACGARRIAILNTHGGNLAALRAWVAARAGDGGPQLSILNPMPPIEQDAREAAFGIHAGEYETSLLLAAVPGLCRMDRADCAWIDEGLEGGDLRPEFAPATFSWISRDLTPTGTMGDARQATAAKGEAWLGLAVDQLLRQIRELAG